jgi:hypothetical protein
VNASYLQQGKTVSLSPFNEKRIFETEEEAEAYVKTEVARRDAQETVEA